MAESWARGASAFAEATADEEIEGTRLSSVRSVNLILNGERANANAFLLENNDGSLFKIILNPFQVLKQELHLFFWKISDLPPVQDH